MPSESKWFKMMAKLIIWSILAALAPKLYKMMQNKPFGRLQPTPPRGMCPSTNPSEGYVTFNQPLRGVYAPPSGPPRQGPFNQPFRYGGPREKNKIRQYGRRTCPPPAWACAQGSGCPRKGWLKGTEASEGLVDGGIGNRGGSRAEGGWGGR